MYYLPIQKLAKILPKSSSLVISPVMVPKLYKACLISMASKSPDIWFCNPSSHFLMSLSAFDNASKCLAFETIVPSWSGLILLNTVLIVSFNLSMSSLLRAEITRSFLSIGEFADWSALLAIVITGIPS